MGKRKHSLNSLVIGTFSSWKDNKRTPTNGMIEPLLSFFSKRVKNITLIDAQHPGSSNVIPAIEHYREGKLISTTSATFLFPPRFILEKNNFPKTQPSFKIRDFTTTSEVLLTHQGQVDLFIGLESIFTIAGLMFKKFGKVKIVVYYVSDYSPTRYSSNFLNKIYLWLDRICATHADFIWDVSPAMMPARIKHGLNPQKAAPCILVPNALFPSQIINKSDTFEPLSVAFAGTMGPENGVGLAIEAINLVKKSFPKVTFHIFGGGGTADEQRIKSLIKKLKLDNNVILHGFVSDLKELSEKLSHFMIGVAPYRAFPSSVRWYADATKLRLYFGCGLPVVSTHVAPLAHETAKKGAVIVTKDEKKQLASAIISLFKDEQKYKAMRKAAKDYARTNTWNNSYSQALKKMDLFKS